MVKVAVPVFERRVSPRFGLSPEMWVYTIEEGKVLGRERLAMTGFSPAQWVRELLNIGVDTLICGGIDGFYCNQLQGSGISIISDVMGEAEEIFSLFLKGGLSSGYCKRRRRRFSGPPWAMDGKNHK